MAEERVSWGTWGRELYREAVRERVPISASVALTHRCNLDCVHCYLRDARCIEEMDAREWTGILDDMASAGCLWLTITGGEPLVHPGFSEIYMHAKRLGFLVTVFTNGTLIDAQILRMMERWPPHSVEISLYGESRETWDAVTGSPGARDACFSAVEALLENDVHLALKTVALRQNVSELEAIRDRCARWGVDFRMDPGVTPCLGGEKSPCASRLDEDEILGLDASDPGRREAWMSSASQAGNLRRTSLFTCGAGRMSFHVHPDGGMALCLHDEPVHDLTRGSVLDGWNGPIHERRRAPLPPSHPCSGCTDQVFCGLCPPLARMETGDEMGIADQICRLGRSRRRVVERLAEAKRAP